MSKQQSETSIGPLTLALIGAGKAGRSLAAQAVAAGYHVVLEDVLPSRLREALQEIPVMGMKGTLRTVTTVEDAVREADLAIDFVPDELESKLEIVCMVDRMAPPKTVLCINTSALSVSDLAACTYRADRCVGVTFEEDAAVVVRGRNTAEGASHLLQRLAESTGHRVQVRDEILQ